MSAASSDLDDLKKTFDSTPAIVHIAWTISKPKSDGPVETRLTRIKGGGHSFKIIWLKKNSTCLNLQS